MSGGSDDRGFLARWSRRKAAAREDERDETPAPAPEPALVDAAAPPAPTAPPAPAESEPPPLPSIESLTAESDVSVFMRPGVPEALRTAALRKMWLLDPAIRNFEGPARDYGYDWNVPGGVPGSGLPPTVEEAERVLARLFEDRPDAAPPAPDAGRTTAAGAGPEPAAVASKPAPPRAAQEQVQAQPAQEQVPAPPAQENAVGAGPSTPAPPRRHGGALPS
jgi:hypothetical protein